MNIAKKVFYILSSLWIMKVFLQSLPYKFSGHEHTQFIFGTIGDWISGILGNTIGQAFGNYAAYVIGTGELIISLVLLTAIVFMAMKKDLAEKLFAFG